MLKQQYQEGTICSRYSLVGFHSLPHIALHNHQVLHLLRGCPGPGGGHDPAGHGEHPLALAGGRRDAEDDPDHISNTVL